MTMFLSHSPEETESLGEKMGRAAERGLVIALTGELGAGKTRFVAGLARGLGSPARVHSPTFTLVNEYGGGRLPLFHLDLYRIESPGQILSAGLDEFWQPEGVTVVEWAERIPTDAVRTTHWVRVKIEIIAETGRKVFYDDFGA
jgi:tRNA threonylcarbamoyladenosine biosynthesis protein TsaE